MLEYFLTMAVLFLLYVSFRSMFASAKEDLSLAPTEAKGFFGFLWNTCFARPRPPEFDGKGIEAGEIARRIREVRENLAAAKISSPSVAAKRALRVENRREQLAGSAYFQRPSPAEPLEPDHGTNIILV